MSITAFALGCCYVYAQPLLFCPPFELSSLADIAINISIMPVQGVDMRSPLVCFFKHTFFVAVCP